MPHTGMAQYCGLFAEPGDPEHSPAYTRGETKVRSLAEGGIAHGRVASYNRLSESLSRASSSHPEGMDHPFFPLILKWFGRCLTVRGQFPEVPPEAEHALPRVVRGVKSPP